MSVFAELAAAVIIIGVIFLAIGLVDRSNAKANREHERFMLKHRRADGEFGDCGEADCLTCRKWRKRPCI